MDFTFDVTIKNRQLLNHFLESFTLEQLNKVPTGYTNNIFWNVAHTVVTQQLLVYKLSGLDMLISDALVEAYKKGTKTEGDVTQAEVDEVKGLLFSTIEKTKEDYNNKVFKTYNEYTVSTKSTLRTAEDAITFNTFHEGIHLGYILALKKNI
ncbi:DinB family protein [Psychroserpens sp. NJDZ02]|uniref:DinB family protein n=1 Tax=Psychroserpens sp. NJDZ02 TaxID=2570561 RepID=UPI0010A818B1|nr:DinB family protein [Psychroserpens sp. NJDZ02]QCE41388.1 DinB family protein [Psychroserpens sp. NJDZ02]